MEQKLPQQPQINWDEVTEAIDNGIQNCLLDISTSRDQERVRRAIDNFKDLLSFQTSIAISRHEQSKEKTKEQQTQTQNSNTQGE